MLFRQRRPNDPLNDLVKDCLAGKHDLIGIEIGSYRGESTSIFLNSNAFSKLYCIDPWMPGYDPKDLAATDEISLAEVEFDERFKDNAVIIKLKQTSDSAVSLFQDESIDFIYIDGNHQYEFVKRDILNYLPKLKTGCYITGHDWHPNWPGVIKAVREVFGKDPERIYGDTSWKYTK